MNRPDAARFAPEFLEKVNAKAKNAAQKVIVKEVVKETMKQLKKGIETRIESRLAVEGAATPAEMMTLAQEIAAELLDQLFGAEKVPAGPQKAPEAPVTTEPGRQAPAPYPDFRSPAPVPTPSDTPSCPAPVTTDRPAGYQEPAPYPSFSDSPLPPAVPATPIKGQMPPPFWPTISHGQRACPDAEADQRPASGAVGLARVEGRRGVVDRRSGAPRAPEAAGQGVMSPGRRPGPLDLVPPRQPGTSR